MWRKISVLILLLAQPLHASLPPLAELPPWQHLIRWDDTLTRAEFEDRVRRIYSPDKAFFKYWTADDSQGMVYEDLAKTHLLWTVHFLPPGSETTRPPPTITDAQVAEAHDATPEKPLNGLTICLDPGHIGGIWADTEERSFRIRNGPLIQEATLNLTTCECLCPLLENAGANVVWTKRDTEPVTRLRSWDFWNEAVELMAQQQPKFFQHNPSRQKVFELFLWHADILFYRISEIQARAEKVNNELHPDLTLCLHYNAAAWHGRPSFTDINQIVVFIHGSYTADELQYDNQKFALINKLFENSSPTEQAIGDSIGTEIKKGWNWPPENYGGSGISHGPAGNPYVWYRNLLANRLYNGPVVFVEGPFMNNRHIYQRLIEGDYEGEKVIEGKKVRSVYREYAEIVAAGVIDYYRQKLTPPATPSPAATGTDPRSPST